MYSGRNERSTKSKYLIKTLNMGGGIIWWSKDEGREGRARRGEGWRGLKRSWSRLLREAF